MWKSDVGLAKAQKAMELARGPGPEGSGKGERAMLGVRLTTG